MDRAKIERDFTYHPPKPGQVERYAQIRDMGKAFAFLIADLTPQSPDQAVALTLLNLAVMAANAAIARNE